MRRLIAFFVDRSLLVNLVFVFVILFGSVVAWITTRALLPGNMPSRIEISAMLPSASAIDMERFVTFRLEQALQGMEGVEHVTSTTTNGLTRISLELKPEVEEPSKVLEESRSRLSTIGHLLPDDLRPLRIEERQSPNEVIELLVENVDEGNRQHRQAIESLAERLRRVPDVIYVKSSLREMDLYIRFSSAALQQAGLSPTVARARIMEFLGHMPIGGIQVKDREVAVEMSKPFADLDDLRAIPLIVNRAGQGVTLGQVATVEYGFAEEMARRTLEGKRYVSLDIVSSAESDTIALSTRVRQVLEAHGDALPEPLTLRVGGDASELISHELATLKANGLGGVLIVLVILMLFLGWRVSTMTALGLPFCYLGVVLVLHLFDMNFNLVSLVAMILVIGILVDDAIIVSEEFCQLLGQGMSSREAAIGAVLKVGKPVLGMVATTTVAFLPLVFLKGGASWMLRPLPIIIIAALFLSLIESFFLLPNHLRHLLPSGTKAVDRRPVIWLRRLYQGVLVWVLKLRYLSLAVVVALVVAAVVLLQGPVKFSGRLSLMGRAVIHIELKEPAQSLDQLAEKLRPVEALVGELPSELLKYYTTRLGESYALKGDNLLRGWKYAQIEIYPPGTFVEQEEKRYIIGERLGDKLKLLEEEGFTSLRLHSRGSDQTRDVVTVYVSGGDRIDFSDIQGAIRKTITQVENVKDVFMDEARFQQALRFAVDQKAVLSYGLSEMQVQAQLRESFSRQELMRIRHKGEEIEVFLGSDQQLPPDPKALSEMAVMSPRGMAVPLSYLGSWEKREVLRQIEHQDTLRMFQIDVLYDESKVDAEQISEAIEKNLDPIRQQYAGYHISVKPSEQEKKAKEWIIKLVVICVGLIYLCLALSLNSLVQPIVVIFAIPFGFIGVVLAFYFHGMELGIMATIGILGLAGVVVNDSLVMTSTINDCLIAKPQAGLRAAIIEGAGFRFRAVVLTSLTTLGGVFPLAYGIAGEAGWLQPMVLAVGWGLFFATLLTLFFIPCLLLMIDDVRRVGAFVLRPLGFARKTKERSEIAGKASSTATTAVETPAFGSLDSGLVLDVRAGQNVDTGTQRHIQGAPVVGGNEFEDEEDEVTVPDKPGVTANGHNVPLSEGQEADKRAAGETASEIDSTPAADDSGNPETR